MIVCTDLSNVNACDADILCRNKKSARGTLYIRYYTNSHDGLTAVLIRDDGQASHGWQIVAIDAVVRQPRRISRRHICEALDWIVGCAEESQQDDELRKAGLLVVGVRGAHEPAVGWADVGLNCDAFDS